LISSPKKAEKAVKTLMSIFQIDKMELEKTNPTAEPIKTKQKNKDQHRPAGAQALAAGASGCGG
jgi:hypothetical protein